MPIAGTASNTKHYNVQEFTEGFVDAGPDIGFVSTTVGAEGAVASNAIEIACAIKDSAGDAVTAAKVAHIVTLAVTDDKGDIAAAGTPVGTLNKAVNPATGPNTAMMTSTAGGLFSFRVSDDAAEVVLVSIFAEGCRPKTFKLTFA